MEKNTEKDFYEFLTRDIIQNYLKTTERNIVLIQNAETNLITKICDDLEQKVKEKGRITQKIEAANLHQLIEPTDGITLIIHDPYTKIRYNGKIQDKTYRVDVNELIRIFHNPRQSHAGYHRPF